MQSNKLNVTLGKQKTQSFKNLKHAMQIPKRIYLEFKEDDQSKVQSISSPKSTKDINSYNKGLNTIVKRQYDSNLSDYSDTYSITQHVLSPSGNRLDNHNLKPRLLNNDHIQQNFPKRKFNQPKISIAKKNNETSKD